MTAARDGLPDGPLVAWYGDDFTGSAAVMEVLSFSGLPSVLYQHIPTEAQAARFAGMRGIGLASTARTQDPAWMEAELPTVFSWLKAQGAPLVHYKICSTLDSSPSTGSIGKATDIAIEYIDSAWIPFLAAAPAIRRYQAFGNLFAAGPDKVYRLDRHPSMMNHPTTPMDEADVCKHLSRQTRMPMAVLDIEALESDAEGALTALRKKGAQLIALDTVTDDHLRKCGELIWSATKTPAFAVGSQGVEYAVVAAWQKAGLIAPPPPTPCADAVDKIVVVSGSASHVTAAQMDWASQNGFLPIRVPAPLLVVEHPGTEVAAVDAALDALNAGKDPILFTADGPQDPAIAEARDAAQRAGLDDRLARERIGSGLGRILKALLARSGLHRVIIAGGDTSGQVVRALDVFAFTALAPTIPGAALLTAHSDTSRFDGLQVALKGGQMGSVDYFAWIKAGGGPRQKQEEELSL